jgi:ribonuclease H2 subunit A
VLGVDEAGRGPVMGSMVYAVAYTPISLMEKLKQVGFADSKVLKEAERDALFKTILAEKDWIGYAIHSLSPQDISSSMLKKQKYNLNAMAHDTTIELIQGCLTQKINITKIYVDTVGPPEKYEQKLKLIFPNIDITVAKKADSKYPIVSAASICAKVTRDESIHNWKFIENIDFDMNIGSGYPGGNLLINNRSEYG